MRKKLDDKTWKGIFFGYTHNGYHVWNPSTKRIIHGRDVEFDERRQSVLCKNGVPAIDVLKLPLVNFQDTSADHDLDKIKSLPSDRMEEDVSNDDFNSFREDEQQGRESQSGSEEESGDIETVDQENERRPQRQRIVPSWHKDYEVDYAAYALNAVSYDENLPNSLAEARTRSDWHKWKAAIQEEMDSLLKNKTWKLMKLPEGRKTVYNKWVFKVKHRVDGAPDRYKARLVARGFSQKYGIDYSETYSPVAKLDTLRTVLAFANQKGMVVHQMDVKTAFLNGSLSEELYMDQAEGFEHGKGLVCRLEKSIYGLKQASRAWNDRFHSFVSGRLKFQRSKND